MVLTVFFNISDPQHQYRPFIVYHKIGKTFELSLKNVSKKLSSFKRFYGDQILVACVVVVSKCDQKLDLQNFDSRYLFVCLNSLENNFGLFPNFILGKVLRVTLQIAFQRCNILLRCCEDIHA